MPCTNHLWNVQRRILEITLYALTSRCSFLNIFVQPSWAQLHRMVEILCKPDDTKSTARETEFFAIRLVDLGLDVKPRFLIREISAVWSDSEQGIEWNVHCESLCCTPEDAQQKYVARRANIVTKGYNCSCPPSGAT
jgi:hypothetical protein